MPSPRPEEAIARGPADPPFPHPLLESLRNAPDSAAFEHGPRTVSRGELLETIRRLAGAMRGAGLGPGRALAVRTALTPEAFAAHMAAHALGCRVVGVRPGYPAGQLAHVLGTGIDALLLDASTLTPELPAAAGPVAVLSLGPAGPGAADLLAVPDDGSPLAVTARPDDVAALTFTSGSTGRPKGCAITYRALSAHWAWQPRAWSPVAAAFARDFERYLLFGTLASMVVLEFLAPCLLGGGTAVIPEEDGRPLFPYAIERHRITGSIITVPRLGRMLGLLRTEPVDVGSLRALMVSGSPISPRRLAAAADLLGPVVYQGYGQTEAGSISMLTPADIARGPERVLASVGRPHPGVEISVRDGDGRQAAPGTTGEIHVRSPYVMAGYWGRPEETRDTLREGWLRTRDLGRLDGEGLLYLTGRTRDVIMVNAMVVYAGPIEQVLAGHPDVEEAYVAGAPDERTGEAVHAFVVAAPGRVPDRDALAALVRAELGEDSVPLTVTTVPGVPLAPGGKPDKRALLERYASPAP
ncbi:class I adenylate-forming enzyme family protein [Planobispora takensis]|uniref:AMP-dependent synthetase n=1 Tax=Planobispora takensis TaxID=1367882 RepID=A0A8J3T1M4_9ACTN|nr:AMP-binding protein [Planobispora takensis]GII04457.1 AMP-dependent synthetase [Planobispora takensis]